MQIIPIKQNPVVVLEVETCSPGLKGVRAKRDTKGDLDKGNRDAKMGRQVQKLMRESGWCGGTGETGAGQGVSASVPPASGAA